ncbi:MAG: hypothetical protein H0T09_03320 [Actinobacteria bacterium]|nr:hypothetical protein [Actinomycetota bacterium]
MAKVNPRAARERKQKIFVAVGGLLLLAMLAIQLPKILGGSSTEAAATTETTLAGEATTPVSDGPSGGVPTALVDTRYRLAAGPGQLRSFSMFDHKDPFVQQLQTPDATPGSDGGGADDAGGGGEAGTSPPSADKPPPTEDFSTDDPAAPAVTVISVNGTRQALVAGTVFPAADPVFVLIAENPKAKTVVVGIAGGSYANGAGGTKLRVGKPLILVNTSTGARYRLVLVAVGEGAAPTAKPDEVPDKP